MTPQIQDAVLGICALDAAITRCQQQWLVLDRAQVSFRCENSDERDGDVTQVVFGREMVDFSSRVVVGLTGAPPLSVSPASVCVLNLQSDGDAVTDANPHLASCCELLELVLRKGLQRQYPHNIKIFSKR